MMRYNDEFKVSLNQKLRSLFLMLIGIYNSATILSVNNNLRKYIQTSTRVKAIGHNSARERNSKDVITYHNIT